MHHVRRLFCQGDLACDEPQRGDGNTSRERRNGTRQGVDHCHRVSQTHINAVHGEMAGQRL
jgi:hypothetical protein